MKKKPLNRKPQQLEVYRDALAGVAFSDYQKDLELRVGSSLRLIWERKNPRDSNAIAVYHKNIHIGYIKRKDTELLHSYREKGIKLTATLSAYNKNNPTWHMLVVCITAPNIIRVVDYAEF